MSASTRSNSNARAYWMYSAFPLRTLLNHEFEELATHQHIVGARNRSQMMSFHSHTVLGEPSLALKHNWWLQTYGGMQPRKDSWGPKRCLIFCSRTVASSLEFF